METTVPNELTGLAVKIGRLAAQRDEALKRLRKAEEETADLRRELAAMREELHRKELDVEYLSLSHKLADTPQALAEARKTVRRMLAGVERALALLKEDARL